MRILHTEASLGWGGQEIRILKEARAMRELGHHVVFATHPDAQLRLKAKEDGFTVYSMPLEMKLFPWCVLKLMQLILYEKIDIVNTHSSTDAWIAGVAARLTGRSVIRTRHISAKIKAGLNSIILYRWLASAVATTCQEVATVIQRQAGIDEDRCSSVPTGVEPSEMTIDPTRVVQFKQQYGIKDGDCVVGTLCILRSWKGINDFLQAAALLKNQTHIKWMIVGSGPGDKHYREEASRLGLTENVIFTGLLEPPFEALSAFDIFTLLSTGNEGVSQASLQAAYLGKPLITTPTGGLKEVTIDGETGFLVPINSPQQIAEKVLLLASDREKRLQMGQKARDLVSRNFLFSKTILDMLEMYKKANPKLK